MRKNKPLPDDEYLKSILIYNKPSGLLVWRFRHNQRPQWNSRYAGKVAGHCFTNRSGKTYINIVVDGEKFLAHRVVWKMTKGDEPDEVDHIDGNGRNNRLENLRSSDCVSNHRNKRLSIKNSSGCVGVSRRSGRNKWRADIKVNGKSISIGSYDTFAEALAARKNAEKIYGFHNEHGTERPF